MSRQTLTAAANHFFSRILPAATQKRFADLANAEVLLGAYRRYTGAAVQAFGQSVTPEFVLKVVPTAVPMGGGAPTFGEAAVAADAHDQPLLWLRYAADAKTDDQATIQDLMGDLDTYASTKLNLAGVDVDLPDDIPAPANCQKWAQTIQANRAALPDNLATLTEVPAAFRPLASSVDALRVILTHFFTYDEQGAYYPRWNGSGRNIPQDLTDAYRKNNVRELKLARDQMYVYLLAPKSLFTTKDAQAHDFCEAVLRFEETGDDDNPYLPTLIQSVYRRMPEGTAPFHDFVFFEAEDGVGLAVPPPVRAKMSTGLTNFLLHIPDKPAERAVFFQKSTHVLVGDPPEVLLLATINGDDLPLPPEATGQPAESGGVMMLHAPVETVPAIAALPAVVKLDLAGYPMKPYLDKVRAAINHQPYQQSFATKKNGAGVLIGIIDSGIDGAHPAFKDASGNSRILAYWDQGDGEPHNPNSPAAHNPTVKAYRACNFGRELTGAACVGAKDYDIGHGTHVSGIAGGSAVTDPVHGDVPQGMATEAKYVVVSAIGRKHQDEGLALAYIFQKATELGMPCVVNMSFGQHMHAHDGTDGSSTTLTRQLVDAKNNYRPGRIIVAAAGNERRDPIHVGRTLAKNAGAAFGLVVNGLADPANLPDQDSLTIWMRPLKEGVRPNVRIMVQDPVGGWSSTAVTPSTGPAPAAVPGTNTVVVHSAMTQDPHNKDYNVQIDFLNANTTFTFPKKRWNLVITNLGEPVELHVWDGWSGAFVNLLPTDNTMKVGAPACGDSVISVAASCTRLSWLDADDKVTPHDYGEKRLGDIASFSSQGPLRTSTSNLWDLFGITANFTRSAIDITAPGSATQSALASAVDMTLKANHDDKVNDNSRMMQGTSMATPVITGLIACLLAEEPTLTQADARNRVRAAGKLPAPAATIFNPGAPNKDDWGTGLIDAPSLKPPHP